MDSSAHRASEGAPREREALLERGSHARTAELLAAQEALQASERRFRAIIEQSYDAFTIVAPDGTIVYASPTIVRIGGRTPEEVIGHGALEWIHPDDLADLSERFQEFLERPGEGVTVRQRYLHKDGSWRWVEATSTNFLAEPSVGGIVCSFHDVTDQWQAEQARAQLAAIVESTGDGILSIDLNGIIQTWNAGAERLFGYTALEIIGRPVEMLIPQGDQDLVCDCIERGTRGEAIPTFEAQRLRKDGVPLTVAVTLSSLRRPGGEITGMCAIYRDITKQVRLEAQLRQAQKMEAIGRLAGGVAHDFNNLLTIINGYSELVLDAVGQHEETTQEATREAIREDIRPLVGEIHKAGTRAAALTGQLLAFSRKQIVQPSPVDLSGLVHDLQRMLARVIGEDIELTTTLRPGLDPVSADPAQLEQIILNLAVNARDAMPQGGRLTIRTENVILDDLEPGPAEDLSEVRPGAYVRLSVSDTGCGMSAETLTHLFEPFFTTKQSSGGTGLGLATVYGLTKQFGGHVRVQSEVGRGSTFQIDLPALPKPSAPDEDPTDRPPLPRGSETVLLVEDEDGVRAVAGRMLRQLGYSVLVAADGSQALQTFRQHAEAIPLLLTDVVMPGMNGRQVAESVRALCPAVKVLYMSGYTDDAVLRHGISESEVAFLQKPFSMAMLAQGVREVLDAPLPV